MMNLITIEIWCNWYASQISARLYDDSKFRRNAFEHMPYSRDAIRLRAMLDMIALVKRKL